MTMNVWIPKREKRKLDIKSAISSINFSENKYEKINYDINEINLIP